MRVFVMVCVLGVLGLHVAAQFTGFVRGDGGA